MKIVTSTSYQKRLCFAETISHRKTSSFERSFANLSSDNKKRAIDAFNKINTNPNALTLKRLNNNFARTKVKQLGDLVYPIISANINGNSLRALSIRAGSTYVWYYICTHEEYNRVSDAPPPIQAINIADSILINTLKKKSNNDLLLFKTSQISRVLNERGFSLLIPSVEVLPKHLKTEVYNFIINNNPNIEQLQDFINNIKNNPKKLNINTNDIWIEIFKNQPYNKEEFFKQIPRSYISFVSKILLNKEKRPEDLHFILETIQEFEKIKQVTTLPIERDINKYKSFRNLIETINRFMVDKSKNGVHLRIDLKTLKGVDLVIQDNGYSVWKVSDKESLEKIGEGTKWCTRKSYKDCQSSHYIEEYKYLYIITKGGNLLYQFTPDFSQFMDVNDNRASSESLLKSINLDKIIKLEINNYYNKYNCLLEYSSDLLKNNRDFVLELVKQYGSYLEYASERLKNDRYVTLVAVKQDGSSLEYASERLKNDRDVVLIAVKESGYALEYASNELKDDYDIVLTAVKRSGSALRYASKRLKNNYNIVIEAVTKEGDVLSEVSEEMRNNKSIVQVSIQKNGNNLRFASESLKNDPEVVLEAIKQDPGYFVHAGREIKNNRNFIAFAAKQKIKILYHISDELKKDRNFIFSILKENPENFTDIPYSYYNVNFAKDLYLANPEAINYIPKDIKNRMIIYNPIKR